MSTRDPASDAYHAAVMSEPYFEELRNPKPAPKTYPIKTAIKSIIQTLAPGLLKKNEPETPPSTPAFHGAKIINGTNLDPSSEYFAVYSTWDPHSIIDETVLRILISLKQAGFRTILVSTSESISTHDTERLQPLCEIIIHRENIGYDFYSYKAGIDYLHSRDVLKSAHGLLIMNDSLVGPFASFNELLIRLKSFTQELCGLNDTFQQSHHLQSCFVYFPSKLINIKTFHDFWNQIIPTLPKQQVINRYEVGLSRHFQQAGIPLKSLYPINDITLVARDILNRSHSAETVDTILKPEVVNPTLLFWSLLIDQFDFPFVKRAVLLDSTPPNASSFNFLAGRDEVVPVMKAYIERVRPIFTNTSTKN